jgi:dTMP kinase
LSGRGRFVTFEGIDGAGKSTHIEFVADALRRAGRDLLVTREPGGTELGEALRALILGRAMTPQTETLLMFAARAEHVAQVITPALANGRWVLCDRFTDATFAYQAGGRGLPEAAIAVLEDWVHPALQPDLTFLFDVDPALAAQRLAGARAADRFEAEQREFFGRVRATYLKRAAMFPARIVVIDGARPVAAIRGDIGQELSRWIAS